MSNLFIGYLFTCLDLTINFNGHRLDFLPDFLGFLFICMGCKELKDKSRQFRTAFYLSVALGIYHIPLYFSDLLNLNMNVLLGSAASAAETLSAIVVILVNLLMTRYLVLGISDMEALYNANLRSTALRKRWELTAIASGILCFTSLLTLLGSSLIVFLSVPVMIASAVFQILFLYTLYQSNKEYKTLGVI